MSDLNPKHLGKQSSGYDSPSIDILDAVPNPQQGYFYVARYTCPEFTSLCPMTGQPDFAKIIIDYIPGLSLIESKSLKLYLSSFRNHGAFHESCSMQIATDFVKIAQPIWFRIAALWYPRGGIPIDVFWQTDTPPVGVLIPDLVTSVYRGRD